MIADRRFSFLANAGKEAKRRGLFDVPVVDCDCHLYESTALPEIARYIDKPNIRRPSERSSPGMAWVTKALKESQRDEKRFHEQVVDGINPGCQERPHQPVERSR